MRQIADILAKAVGRPEILKAARARRTMAKWADAVGPVLAGKTSIASYDYGILVVEATGSAWAQEVRMRQELILERMNAMAEEQLFTKIVVKIGRTGQAEA